MQSVNFFCLLYNTRMYLLLLKFASIRVLLSQHFFKYAVVLLFLVLCYKVFRSRTAKSISLQRILVIGTVSALAWYVGPFQLLGAVLVFLGAYFIGERFGFEEHLLRFASGFFLLLQVYIIASVIANPQLGLWAVLGISSVITVVMHAKKRRFIAGELIFRLYESISALSVPELFMILLAFFYGSIPQSSFNWDSVYANLYNAKWYVELNSLKPLEESISTFFPQHAILYYALFYALGGLRMLQGAYLLPLFLITFTVRAFLRTLKAKEWYNWIILLLLFTPIVLAQSSSGYYDLFVASLIVLSVYVLFFAQRVRLSAKILFSTLLLGVANASKLFSLGLSPVVLGIFTEKRERTAFAAFSLKKRIVLIFLGALLLFAPVTYWMARSYANTGSPIYPLFQNIFRTEELWESGGSVEQNAMTQTEMPARSWFSGGIFAYPILTYFRTEYYVEATRGYPGIIYILLLPLQLFLLGVCIWHAVKKKVSTEDVVYVVTFLALLVIGLVTRYYRYVWPFQFTFGLLTLMYGWKYVRRITLSPIWLVFPIIALYAIHAVDLMDSFHFSPVPQKRQILQPDALRFNPQDSVWDVLNAETTDKPTLDASEHSLPRVYLSERSFQCNWYWVNGEKKVNAVLAENEGVADFIRQFSYVITPADPTKKATYCTNLIQAYPHLKEIVKNATYAVYKVE